MYPQTWHTRYGATTGRSAEAILPPLMSAFSVKSVVEVGCGNAHWSNVAAKMGVSDYLVVDGPWNDGSELLVDPQKFVQHNLKEPIYFDRHFDLAICLEVAEHVCAEAAGNVVRSLINLSDIVLFGAAIPLQGGHGHVNEQWASWWRDLFHANGFELYDAIRPYHWTDESIHYWYRQNCFLYVNSRNEGALGIAAELQRQAYSRPVLIDAVHPEKYSASASYESISGARLFRRLPKWFMSRVAARLRGEV